MQDANAFGGRILEIRRHVTPLEPLGPNTNRERWELWMKPQEGVEEKFVVPSRTMPARRGHFVVLALDSGTPVGIVNLLIRHQ